MSTLLAACALLGVMAAVGATAILVGIAANLERIATALELREARIAALEARGAGEDAPPFPDGAYARAAVDLEDGRLGKRLRQLPHA